MLSNLSLMAHFLYIVSVATLLLSALSYLICPFIVNWIQQFNPQSRLILLRGFGALPLIGALVLGLMVSIPSLSHSSTLPIDHCHGASDCFIPQAAHMATHGELVVISIFCSLLLWAVMAFLAHWRRSSELLERFDLALHSRLESSIQLIETKLPLAFSLGMLKPRIVISTGLVNRLSAQQLSIVRAHELIHVRYKDGLYKWILLFVGSFHWPSVKRIILDEHAVALELRADQQVARSQSNIAVAETIVAVQRLMCASRMDESICQFLGSKLEQRIHYLLSKAPDKALPKRFLLSAVMCSLFLSIAGSVPLHNAIEALLIK